VLGESITAPMELPLVHMADGPQVCTIVPVAEGVADGSAGPGRRSYTASVEIVPEAAYNSSTSQAGGQQRQSDTNPGRRSAGASCSDLHPPAV
jgi:hypothetical protein